MAAKTTGAGSEGGPLTLSNLKPAQGSTQARKRVGRGPGSGLGKTSGKGNKGHKARTGGGTNPGFEGGQMPMYRRLPKRGFTNIFKKEFAVVNLSDLDRFEAGSSVDEAMMRDSGLLKGRFAGIKVLGDGKLTKKLTVHAAKFSESARKQIEAAGGTCQEIA